MALMHLNKVGIGFINFIFQFFGFGRRQRAIVGAGLARVNSFMAPDNFAATEPAANFNFCQAEKKATAVLVVPSAAIREIRRFFAKFQIFKNGTRRAKESAGDRKLDFWPADLSGER
jgi:hypothetical protein